MIAQLTGQVIDAALEKDTAKVVVDVHGVGYEVLVTPTSQTKILPGQTLVLYVCESVTAFDGATTLYGFLTRDDKDVFMTLRHNVDGMGPKKALECLEKISKSLPDFKRAILDNDTRLLVSVFGFTKKTAEKLVVSLKDGVGAWTMSGAPKWAEAAGRSEESETLSALINLGYDSAEARDLLREAKSGAGEKATVEVLLQEALRIVSQKR
jgi:Holliday junction DNA helicase RuvA